MKSDVYNENSSTTKVVYGYSLFDKIDNMSQTGF